MLIPVAVVEANNAGVELAYAEKTSDTSITATSEATADTVVTAGAVVLDGSTKIIVEFSSPTIQSPGAAGSRGTFIVLYAAKDGAAAASLGRLDVVFNATAAQISIGKLSRRIYTPTVGSYVFSIRSYVTAGTGTVEGGTGVSGGTMPAYIRVTVA
jgi:hypothetical protein